MLDLSQLEGAWRLGVELICALPPLPALQLAVMPTFYRYSERGGVLATDGVVDWLCSSSSHWSTTSTS